MSPRVVLFIRYPEPGKAKTRLIPALGAERAAALHRMLSERTIETVRASGLPFELRITGAPREAFEAWLGPVLAIDQGDGDLGARLARATEPTPVIFIGTDAPDLAPAHLEAAAAALESHSATIGPAEDGGYWLLGLARAIPELFDGIVWGTETVFAATLERLERFGIAPVLLPRLADLDRPEDLARWPGLAA